MAEPKPPHIDRPINGGLQNNFHPISQDSKESLEPVKVVESKEKAYTKTENELIITENQKNIKKCIYVNKSLLRNNNIYFCCKN